jgi:phage baseplate assembly protein W
MPNFGTCIPSITFDNGTPELVDQIKRDVKAVIDYDPRVRLMGDINVYFIADRHVIIIQCDLLYVELGIQQPFSVIVPGK